MMESVIKFGIFIMIYVSVMMGFYYGASIAHKKWDRKTYSVFVNGISALVSLVLYVWFLAWMLKEFWSLSW